MNLSHHFDIGYTIMAEVPLKKDRECFCYSEYVCNFKVYQITGRTLEGQPLWSSMENNTSILNVTELDQANVFLHGTIKWDHCSNWYFDEQDACMLHFCGLEDAKNLSVLFERMYKLAKELIKAWDE